MGGKVDLSFKICQMPHGNPAALDLGENINKSITGGHMIYCNDPKFSDR